MLAELVELETRVLESNWMLASLQIRHHWCRLQQAVIHSTKIAISSFGGLAVTPSEPYCCEMRWWRSLNLVLFSLFWSKHEVLLSLVFFCFFFPECTAPLPVCNARSTKHLPLKSHLWRRCHSVSSACCYSANIPSWCLFGLLSGGWVKANFKFLVASSARAAPRPSTTSPLWAFILVKLHLGFRVTFEVCEKRSIPTSTHVRVKDSSTSECPSIHTSVQSPYEEPTETARTLELGPGTLQKQNDMIVRLGTYQSRKLYRPLCHCGLSAQNRNISSSSISRCLHGGLHVAFLLNSGAEFLIRGLCFGNARWNCASGAIEQCANSRLRGCENVGVGG